MQIVQYAGITVMFPAALVIAAWLWVGASRKIAFLWLGVLVTAYLVVGASKILFKGWGIGLHDLGIAVFSGHAHGGQIRLPFVGGIYAPGQGLFPEYTEGVYTEGKTNMIVSRGLGNSLFPLRVFNRPEIVVCELSKGK